MFWIGLVMGVFIGGTIICTISYLGIQRAAKAMVRQACIESVKALRLAEARGLTVTEAIAIIEASISELKQEGVL